VTTFFSLAGVEIAHTVATPPACSARDSTRAFRLISVRVFVIYLASIALILTIVPANTIRPGFSPFTLTLQRLIDIEDD
jgi:GABA permease